MRNTKRSFALFLAIAFILSFASGCDDAYRAAAKGSDDVANGVKAAVAGIGDLYTQGIITQDEKNGAARILLTLTDGNTEFRNNVKTIHARGGLKADYVAAASGFVQSGKNLLDNGDLRVKNPDAQKKLDVWLTAIKTGLDGIGLAIQKAKA